LPFAKILSLLVVFPLGILYSKLADKFSREKMFYALSLLYGLAALGFYWGFSHPEIGLSNTVACSARWIGWLWYVFVESFGSLMVVTFWAFAADTTKIGYTQNQLKWCFDNEVNIWSFIIENEILYTTKVEIINKFIIDGPFTSFFGNESRDGELITVTNCTLLRVGQRAELGLTIWPETSEAKVLARLERRLAAFREFAQSRLRARALPFLTITLDLGEKHRQRIDKLLEA